MFGNVSGPLAYIRAGRMRAIAVTVVEARSPVLPRGADAWRTPIRGFDLVTWMGIFVPAGTPEAIVDRLHGEVRQGAAGARTCSERLVALGNEVVAGSGEELAAHIGRELEALREDHQAIGKDRPRSDQPPR